MRILWFTNTPVSAQKRFGKEIVGESWIGALEANLREEVKEEGARLGIAFQTETNNIESFEINNTLYYSIPKNSGNFQRFFGKRTSYFFNNKKALEDYLDVINRFKPDIIQVFGSENNFGLIIPHTNVPVVIHIQGIPTIYTKKYFSGIPLSEIKKSMSLKERLKNSSLYSYYRFFSQLAQIEQDCLAHCKYVFGRTDWDRRVLKVLSPSAAYYHCDEMLRDDFYSKKWEYKTSQKINLVSLIRNNPYKGMETIIETSQIFLKMKIDFSWSIIGSDKKDKVNKLLCKKYKTNFNDLNIKLLGNLKNASEIVDVFMNSDIYVHTSHIENSPNSVCEAMLLGMPVISTFAGGTSSILEDGKEGILIQDGDPYSLAGTIMELYSDKQLQITFSENARNKAMKRHDKHKIISELLKNYNRIIEKN